MSAKEKQRKRLFLVDDRKCFAVSHFTFICFFDNQSCKCGKTILSHNYIKRDLGNPNFSSTAINSVVHIFKPRL